MLRYAHIHNKTFFNLRKFPSVRTINLMNKEELDKTCILLNNQNESLTEEKKNTILQSCLTQAHSFEYAVKYVELYSKLLEKNPLEIESVVENSLFKTSCQQIQLNLLFAEGHIAVIKKILRNPSKGIKTLSEYYDMNYKLDHVTLQTMVDNIFPTLKEVHSIRSKANTKEDQ